MTAAASRFCAESIVGCVWRDDSGLPICENSRWGAPRVSWRQVRVVGVWRRHGQMRANSGAAVFGAALLASMVLVGASLVLATAAQAQSVWGGPGSTTT